MRRCPSPLTILKRPWAPGWRRQVLSWLSGCLSRIRRYRVALVYVNKAYVNKASIHAVHGGSAPYATDSLPSSFTGEWQGTVRQYNEGYQKLSSVV